MRENPGGRPAEHSERRNESTILYFISARKSTGAAAKPMKRKNKVEVRYPVNKIKMREEAQKH